MKMDQETRRRLASAEYGPSGARFTALEVFEKSKGKCHLCHEAIDPTIRYPHRDSFVRDHVVARWQGGPDTLENSAAAHSRCNRRKSKSLNSPVTAYGSSTSDSVPYVVRMDPSLHTALRSVSSLTGDSMNQIANQALTSYIASPEVQTRVQQMQARQDDAIRKLSGD